MTAPSKPLLLLDIDGVLCPLVLRPPETSDPLWVTTAEFVDRAVPGWLDLLAGAFDIHWASSWGTDANEIFGPALGLQRLPSVIFSRGALLSRGARRTWKLADVAEYAGARPLAWVDDELYEDANAWAHARNERVRTLLVRTSGSNGLQESDVDALLAFAQECQ